MPHLDLPEHNWLPTGSHVNCDQESSFPCQLESETYQARRQHQDQNYGNAVKETYSHNSNCQIRNANQLQNRSRSQEHSSEECTGVNAQQCKNPTEFAKIAQHSKPDSVTYVPDVRSKAAARDFRHNGYIGTLTDSVKYTLTSSKDGEELGNQMTRYSEHLDRKSEFEINGVTDIESTSLKVLQYDSSREGGDTRTSIAFQTVRQKLPHESASLVDHNASSNETVHEDNGVQRGVGKTNTSDSHTECLDAESKHMHSSGVPYETDAARNHRMKTRERLQSRNVSPETVSASSYKHTISQILQKDKGMGHNHHWQKQTIENHFSIRTPASSFIHQKCLRRWQK